MKREKLRSGSGSGRFIRLVNLPAALGIFRRSIEFQIEHSSASEDRLGRLRALVAQLEQLQRAPATQENFEDIIRACDVHEYCGSESFLAFIYGALQPSLVDFASKLLARQGTREDGRALAIDLVGGLFADMAEALMDGELLGRSTRLPPAGSVLPWLFRAIRNDILDHCKSSGNRLERAILPSLDEGYEEAVDRVVRRGDEGREEAAFSLIESGERRDAFLKAFEKATKNLKPRHRNVLELKEIDDASVSEIASRLELSEQQVADLLQYGREKRANLILTYMKSQPALEDLSQDPREVLALLKRVRLWSLTTGLRQWGPPANGASVAFRREGRWAPIPGGNVAGGAQDARDHREL